MDKRILRVQGVGRVETKPDLVVISFEIDSLDFDYGNAINKLNEKVNTLRSDLKEVGIDRKRIKTTDFGVEAKYEDEDDDTRTFIGYNAEHSLRLELKNDIKLLNKVLAQVSRSVSKASFSIYFTTSDKKNLKDKMLENAIKDAQEKAEILSKAANIKLGHILSIDYSWTELRFMSDSRYKMMASMAAPDIEPEDINVSCTVQVSYEIKD